METTLKQSKGTSKQIKVRLGIILKRHLDYDVVHVLESIKNKDGVNCLRNKHVVQ